MEATHPTLDLSYTGNGTDLNRSQTCNGEKRAVSDRGKDRSRYLVLAVVLNITSIVLIVVTLLAAVLLLNKRHELHQSFTQSPIACLECAHMNPGHAYNISDDPLLRKLSLMTENGVEMCCAYNSEQMSAMFQAAIRRPAQPDFPLPSYNVSDFKFSPVSAHKRIYPEQISHDFGHIDIPRNRASKICHLRESDLAGVEHHRGVSILKDRMVIQHTGLYFIYSSVLFRPQSILPCREFAESIFTHSIHLTSNHVIRQLLQTTHTCCDDCINMQETRFTGGLFLLKQGDYIQVKVREYRLVNFEPDSSFVGITMMGGVA